MFGALSFGGIMKFFYAFVGLSGFAALMMIDCGSSPSCDSDASLCSDATTPGPGVSGGGCDSSKTAAEGGCAVDDTDGFFVSPTGSDSAVGSKAAPFQTINKGIASAAANAQKPNVYVCAGTFAENLVIQNAPAGVALHGGFDCASWAQVNAPTTVAPPWQSGDTSAQFVLHVLGAAAVVESMSLLAPDATDPGTSSIAAYVDGSAGMTFRRATVTAGNAADAPQGTALAAAAANSNGNSTTSQQVAGASITCNCTKDTTVGGSGSIETGDAGPTPGQPSIASDPDAGQAGVFTSTCAGGVGANGPASTSNGASTGTLGGLTPTGWVASAGGAGGVGATAQGGGGASWAIANGYAGGGGACGGCGGSGGAGGAGGGASIAIGALTSVVRIQSSTIHAAKAGNGANGVAGQPGQPGGSGGQGQGSFCNGGGGGIGGTGGSGGGGAGGVSVAIAFTPSNGAPDVDTQSTVLAGTAGAGGKDIAQVQAINGVAAPLHSF